MKVFLEIVCFTLLLGLCSPFVHGQDFKIEISPESASFTAGVNDTLLVTITVTSMDSKSQVDLSVGGLPEGMTAIFSAATLIPPGSSSLTLNVSKGVLPKKYTLVVTGSSGTMSRTAPITVEVGDNLFSVVFGVGSLLAGSTSTNYNVQNNTIFATKLGRSTPEVLVGGSFNVKFKRPPNWVGEPLPWNAFVSLRLALGSDRTIGGYVFGGSYRLSKYLDVLAGFSLSPVSEPSQGFVEAAVQAIQANPSLPVYQRFNIDKMRARRPSAFDGFPLLLQTGTVSTGPQIFAGDPLITHYHGGFFIGLAFPFSLKARLTP